MKTFTLEEVQQISQQAAQQAASQAIEQVVQGSSQEKTSLVSSQDKYEETNTGEAHRASVLSQTRLWNLNDKMLSAIELKEKELALAEREAKLRHQAKLDAIEVLNQQNINAFQDAIRYLSMDFRTAAFHPISPNDSDVK